MNESYSNSWDKRILDFINNKKLGEVPIAQRCVKVRPELTNQLSLLMKGTHLRRYIGTFIADFHRTLMYGGIFLYPNNRATPGGKLRLLYECNPASFIVEQAGGRGTDGDSDVLDIKPKTIHDRTQVFLGSRKEIEELHGYLGKKLKEV